MSGTRDAANDMTNSGPTAPSEQSEATPAVPEDTTLPDAQPVAESLTPAKKNAALKFLEYVSYTGFPRHATLDGMAIPLQPTNCPL